MIIGRRAKAASSEGVIMSHRFMQLPVLVDLQKQSERVERQASDVIRLKCVQLIAPAKQKHVQWPVHI